MLRTGYAQHVGVAERLDNTKGVRMSGEFRLWLMPRNNRLFM
jgi:hypothetical protein